ncbi:MAG: CPBP family intramembrane glutamic endopeptidase [Candidatus Acidiferrales bacterium]
MGLDDNNQPQQEPENPAAPPASEPRPESLPLAVNPGEIAPPPGIHYSQRPYTFPRVRTFDPALPEDLRVPWGWWDLVLLVIVAIAGTFVLSMFIVAGFALSGVSLHQLQNSMSDKNLLLIINQALLSVVLLVYLSGQMRLSFGVPFWRTIGWRPLPTGRAPGPVVYFSFIVGGFLLAILVSLGSSAIHTKTQLPIEQFFQDRMSALLLMSLGVLLAPLLEETVFRGYIYPVAARSFGVTGGVLFTGTIFGLLHASQLWGGWGQIALLVIVGIVFTYARAATRTVVASYLMHVSYNSFLFLAMAIGSHGFRHFPGAS